MAGLINRVVRFVGRTFVVCLLSSRRRHTRYSGDWSSDVCSSDLVKTSLARLWDKTAKAMAFNMLDAASPVRLINLYYADRNEFVEFAMSLSPEVEIIDDYPLTEFTIYVKRI